MTDRILTPTRMSLSALGCATAYLVTGVLTAGLLQTISLEQPAVPEGLDISSVIIGRILSAPVMVSGLIVLALGIGRTLITRFAVLYLFCIVTFGVNTTIETMIFTNLGGQTFMILSFLAPCLVACLLVAKIYPFVSRESTSEARGSFWKSRSVFSWVLRLSLAVIAFPMIYLVFGMMVYPFIGDYYADLPFLKIPSGTTILATQFLRSCLYLLVILPILATWSLSRRRLGWSLAWAYFALVGFSGLLSASFFPPVMRIAHSIEILADSVAYGWAVTLLLARK